MCNFQIIELKRMLISYTIIFRLVKISDIYRDFTLKYESDLN